MRALASNKPDNFFHRVIDFQGKLYRDCVKGFICRVFQWFLEVKGGHVTPENFERLSENFLTHDAICIGRLGD
jgi:hypothetical protein